MSETAGLIIVFIGLIFDFFGCFGLVRFPDVFNRVQAATKCVTIGTCFILLGVVVYLGFGAIGIKSLIAMVFIVITTPTAAHAISRAAYLSGVELADQTVVDQYAEDLDDIREKR